MGSVIRNNFTGGELSPAVSLRPDLAKYQSGLKSCENYLVRAQGGVFFRPGTNYCGSGLATSGYTQARLVPFVFSNSQAYILVFTHLRLQVIRDGAILATGTITTPWAYNELWDLDFAQNADTLIITQRNGDDRVLVRTSELVWTLSSVDILAYGTPLDPPEFENVDETFTDTEHTGGGGSTTYNFLINMSGATSEASVGDIVQVVSLTPPTDVPGDFFMLVTEKSVVAGVVQLRGHVYSGSADTGGAGTLTVAKDAQMVGQVLGGGTYKRDYRYRVSAVGDNGEESIASYPPISALDKNSISTTYGVKLQWTHPSPSSVSYYRVYKDQGDGNSFGWIGDSEVGNFTDFNLAPVISDSPISDFSVVNTLESPACVTFYQQRLALAGMSDGPLTVAASQVGRPFDFTKHRIQRDSDAFSLTISAPQVDPIRYLVPLEALYIFTEGAEYKTTEGDSEVFSPTTAGVRLVSSNGCAAVKPVVVRDAILYVQAKGGRVREMVPGEVDKAGGMDLSIMATHLFKGRTIVQMAYSSEPAGVLWCVMSDGAMLALTYQREHEVWAWSKHDLTGTVQSVAVIPENGEDVTYVSVLRNGVRFLERIRMGASAYYGMDSHLSYSGAATASLTGLSHLNGYEVVAVADGAVVTGLTVTGGGVTLPFEAEEVTVGIPYTGTLQLLPVVAQGPRGDAKTISRARVHVESTRGLEVGVLCADGSATNMMPAYARHVNDSYDPQDLYTGLMEVQLQGNWDMDACLQIEQNSPLPQEILAVEYLIDG